MSSRTSSDVIDPYAWKSPYPPERWDAARTAARQRLTEAYTTDEIWRHERK
jgi:hypothetical protein